MQLVGAYCGGGIDGCLFGAPLINLGGNNWGEANWGNGGEIGVCETWGFLRKRGPNLGGVETRGPCENFIGGTLKKGVLNTGGGSFCGEKGGGRTFFGVWKEKRFHTRGGGGPSILKVLRKKYRWAGKISVRVWEKKTRAGGEYVAPAINKKRW